MPTLGIWNWGTCSLACPLSRKLSSGEEHKCNDQMLQASHTLEVVHQLHPEHPQSAWLCSLLIPAFLYNIMIRKEYKTEIKFGRHWNRWLDKENIVKIDSLGEKVLIWTLTWSSYAYNCSQRIWSLMQCNLKAKSMCTTDFCWVGQGKGGNACRSA